MRKYSFLLSFLLGISGCTDVSTKISIEASREIEERQDQIVEQLAYNLETYQYNELKTKIKTGISDTELSDAWNAHRGLWIYMQQWERIRCLKKLTIDTHLYASQSIIDLKIKNLKEFINNAKLDSAATSQP